MLCHDVDELEVDVDGQGTWHKRDREYGTMEKLRDPGDNMIEETQGTNLVYSNQIRYNTQVLHTWVLDSKDLFRQKPSLVRFWGPYIPKDYVWGWQRTCF